ncbi:ATP-binding protein [Streptomyces canus]|uniref:ATP-binding protein n=1 Tax=Streptomyces canus TaxID=58343 RepID=UPI00386FAA44
MVELVVSELATNAYKYAPGPFLLELEVKDGAVGVTVWDIDPTLPTTCPANPGRGGRHGLEVVLAVCRSLVGSVHHRGAFQTEVQVWEDLAVTSTDGITRQVLIRRGFALEYATLGWNVIGIVVLAVAAVSARSVALAGFGLDSLIEIGASTVVIWELSGTGEDRRRRALNLIGIGFALLAVYLLVQSTWVLVCSFRPHHSPLGIGWTGVTAAVMFVLATGKARTGSALDNPVLKTECRVTLIDGLLAVAVLLGLLLNSLAGLWWADPAAGYVLVYYALREAKEIFFGEH